MSDYHRMQTFSSVAAIPAAFVVLGITLWAFGTGPIWWIVGLTLTILSGVPLLLLAVSYWAGNRGSQSNPLLLANGTVATIKRKVSVPWIGIIAIATLLIALMVYVLSPSPISPKIEPRASASAPRAEPASPAPSVPEKVEPIPSVKPIPRKAKPSVTKKDVPTKPKEIVLDKPDKPVEAAPIEAIPIQPKEKLAAVLIRKYPATDPALERLPKRFIQEWLNVINTVNDGMTKHDLQTVLRIRPRLRDAISDSSHLAEAIFTLRCLESEGYVRITETSDRIQSYPGVANNLQFEFVPEKLHEFIEGL